MGRYSLSPQEHEVKRGLRRIQREIKQGIFVDVPIDYEHIFDIGFYVKLSNCKTADNGNDLIINGSPVKVDDIEVTRHEYSDGNMLFYLDNEDLKELLDRYSLSLEENVKQLIMAVLPTSIRQSDLQTFVSDQYRFF